MEVLESSNKVEHTSIVSSGICLPDINQNIRQRIARIDVYDTNVEQLGYILSGH